MILTPTQVDELLKVLDKYCFSFIAHHVGVSILSEEQQELLESSGVILKHIKRTVYNVEHAYKFGIISDSIKGSKVMNYTQLKEYLSKGKFFKLTAVETSALESLKYQTAVDVVRLNNRIKDDISQKLVQADKVAHSVKHHKIVTESAMKAIRNKKYVTEVVSDIGRSTGVWNRDLGRISDYVLHTAFDEGRADAAQRQHGEDALIYKDVYPGACISCTKLYLTGGVGSQPILFKLSELKENGTNIGRKQDEWKPVVGPTHPYCRCTINQAPGGISMEFLTEGRWLWNGSTFERAPTIVPRRVRPKAKVQIGNKTIEV